MIPSLLAYHALIEDRRKGAVGVVDRMHLVMTPALLGAGEPRLAGLDLPRLGFRLSDFVPSRTVAHVMLERDP